MKASKLIEKLQKAIEENGDLEIEARVSDFYSVGGHDAQIHNFGTIEVWHGLRQFRIVCSLNSQKEYNSLGSYEKHPKITFRK